VQPISGEVIKAEQDKDKRKALDDAARIGGIMGFTGLEQQYNDELSGKLGVKTVSIDHRNNVTGTVSEVPATPGNWLVTNIDAKVQAAAEKALEERIEFARTNAQVSGSFRGETAKADAGAAVVLDIKTGGVVALASYPSYDPNVWMRPQSKEEVDALPQLHQATQGQYAPGSTFKVITTAAAVKAGIANFHSSYNCVGSIQAGGRTFRNFDGTGYGWGTLHTALEKSCDTIYFQFGEQLWRADGGINPVAQPKDYVINEALGWGLGARTGIDLPGEAKGSITTRAQVSETYKNNQDECKAIPEAKRNPGLWEICDRAGKYRVGDALNTALGQGTTTATPLQMAVAYAALANGGTMCKPQIAKAIMSPTGEVVKRFGPECDRHLDVPPDVLREITSGLSDVPRTGTAANAFAGFPLDILPVAGKTGTAQVGNRYDTGWFASFAPVDNPRYVVLMVVSEGGGGGWVSAPGVRSIYESIYGLGGREAVLPVDGPPKDLPRIADDGTIEPPAVEFAAVHPDGTGGAAVRGQPDPAALPSSTATPTARGRRR
jgi:penicillin-binding protein 2